MTDTQDTLETEVAFFKFSCTENDGLITLVEPDSENLHNFTQRDCEILKSIIWFKPQDPTQTEHP